MPCLMISVGQGFGLQLDSKDDSGPFNLLSSSDSSEPQKPLE